MIKAKLFFGVVLLSLVTLSAGACAGTMPTPSPEPVPTPPYGSVRVYVTDAPPRDEVTGIMVTVAEVQVHKAVAEQEQEQAGSDNQTQEQEQQQTQQGEGEWITIDISDNATTFDLLQIKGIEQFLGVSEVAAGKYTQVRLVVDTIQVALGGGELQDATVPSKELKITRPFDVVAGEATALTLDFEADKMVTVTGSGKIIVKPVIKLTVRQEKLTGQESGQKPDKGVTDEASVEVSCDDFMSAKHISEEVEINTSDMFKVVLCSNPTTGFQWSESATIDDTALIEQVDHRFVSPKAKGNKPPAPGTPGQEIWTFKALKEGTTTISMEYSQPWEGGEKGEWTFELTAAVD